MEDVQKELQRFLLGQGHLYKTREDAVRAFHNQYKQKLEKIKMDFVEMANEALYDRLEEANEARTASKRRKLLRDIVKDYPDCLSARLQLLEYEPKKRRFDQLVVLEKEYGEKFNDRETWNWSVVEDREYFRLKYQVADTYKERGMLRLAVEHYLTLYTKISSDNLGTRYKLMALYCILLDWKQGYQLFYSDSAFQEDDQMLFPMIVLALLTGHASMAETLFVKLTKVNSEFKAMLQTEDLFLLNFGAEIMSYQRNSISSITIAFRSIANVMVVNHHISDWLYAQYQAVYGDGEGRRYEQLKEEEWSEQDDLFLDLSLPAIRALNQSGLKTFEAFKNWTYQEVLALDGIGKTTMERLVDNGVEFKK